MQQECKSRLEPLLVYMSEMRAVKGRVHTIDRRPVATLILGEIPNAKGSIGIIINEGIAHRFIHVHLLVVHILLSSSLEMLHDFVIH